MEYFYGGHDPAEGSGRLYHIAEEKRVLHQSPVWKSLALRPGYADVLDFCATEYVQNVLDLVGCDRPLGFLHNAHETYSALLYAINW